jgi:hypothetical protein
MAGAALWAALMIAHPAHPQNAEDQANLVLLYGVQFIDSRIVIDVVSFGCADATYFTAKVERSSDALQLSIIQVKPDRCRASPHIVSVTLEIPSIPTPDEDKFRLLNKIAIPTAELRVR